MNIKTGHLKTQIDKILKEDNITKNEIINNSELTKEELNSVLSVEHETIDLEMGMHIALATDRQFRVHKNKIFFYKYKYIEMEREEINELSNEERNIARNAIKYHFNRFGEKIILRPVTYHLALSQKA